MSIKTPDGFAMLQRPMPEQDLGPEFGVFDRYGLLAASYREALGSCHVWVYNKHDARIVQFMIMKNADLARLYCEEVAKERGWQPEPTEPPDLDAMLRDLNQ